MYYQAFFCARNISLLKNPVTLNFRSILLITRKYPLRGYILGVLTHTTAWDQHWGGDETLK